jgi:hypothetical protein
MSGEKMTEEKKMTLKTKLTEETKLFEEKRRLLKKYWKVCLKILMTVIVMMWKVEMKILKIGPGDQTMLSLENRLLNRVILTT